MRRSVRLPAPVRDRLEHTFQTRLGGVAVRLADGPAAGVARNETVTLAERHYRPDTAAGLWLLAHEFAHVVQGRLPGPPATGVEVEASAAGLAVLAGRPFACRRAADPGRPHPWGMAGHYYTSYLVMLAAGADPADAALMAQYCQLPDEVADLDATELGTQYAKWFLGDRAGSLAEEYGYSEMLRGAYDLDSRNRINRLMAESRRQRRQQNQAVWEATMVVQAGLHALTGAPAEAETAYRAGVLHAAAFPSLTFGVGLHAYGDSFAHRTLADGGSMYAGPRGHLFDWHAPDELPSRPDLYQRYVRELYGLVTGKLNRPPVRTYEQLAHMLRGVDRASTPGTRTVVSRAGVFQVPAQIPRTEAEQIADLRAAAAAMGRPMNDYRPVEEVVSWDQYRASGTRRAALNGTILQQTLGLGRSWWLARCTAGTACAPR